MLFISDNLLSTFTKADQQHHLIEFFNRKQFSVKDTTLSYRQINTLDSDKLIGDRSNKQGWHKFSFKEIIYLELVHELKKFGLSHAQLQQFWEAFFKEREKTDKEAYRPQINKHISEIAIGCVFCEVEIIITVTNDGKVAFYDPGNYVIYYASEPKIQLSLNDFVNDLLKKMGKSTFPTTWSLQQAVFDSYKHDLSQKEEELMKIVRNKDYSTIQVQKKNTEIAVVHAEKYSGTDLTEEGLLQLVKNKDYQNIKLVRRDGKIVNYKIEETIKL